MQPFCIILTEIFVFTVIFFAFSVVQYDLVLHLFPASLKASDNNSGLQKMLSGGVLGSVENDAHVRMVEQLLVAYRWVVDGNGTIVEYHLVLSLRIRAGPHSVFVPIDRIVKIVYRQKHSFLGLAASQYIPATQSRTQR